MVCLSGERTIPELEMLAGRSVQDLAVSRDMARRRSGISRFTERFKEATQLPDDYVWFSCAIGGDRALYDKLQASYCQKSFDLDCSDNVIVERAQLCPAFGSAKFLAGTVCGKLQALRDLCPSILLNSSAPT
jgi:hypothetical protein